MPMSCISTCRRRENCVHCRDLGKSAGRISMKSYWLKLLLLATFAYWASGAAKYVHEALEHHGRDASLDDDDDDDDGGPAIAAVSSGPAAAATHGSLPAPAKKKIPCPVCQMLAAMVLDRTAPPVIYTCSTQLVDILVLSDRVAPVLHACFALSARGPPAESAL